MKTWKHLSKITCTAALIGATVLAMPAFAAKAPVAKEPEKIPVILDADMVDLFDDGVAMVMLATSPKVDLKGVTIVIGNSWAQDGTASAIRHLEGLGRTDIPVMVGVNRPTRPGRMENILEERKNFGYGHETYMGSCSYPEPVSWEESYRTRYKSEPTIGPKAEDPSDYIIRTIKDNPHKVTIWRKRWKKIRPLRRWQKKSYTWPAPSCMQAIPRRRRNLTSGWIRKLPKKCIGQNGPSRHSSHWMFVRTNPSPTKISKIWRNGSRTRYSRICGNGIT